MCISHSSFWAVYFAYSPATVLLKLRMASGEQEMLFQFSFTYKGSTLCNRSPKPISPIWLILIFWDYNVISPFFPSVKALPYIVFAHFQIDDLFLFNYGYTYVPRQGGTYQTDPQWWDPDIILQASRAVRSKCLSIKEPWLWSFVTEVQTNYNTPYVTDALSKLGWEHWHKFSNSTTSSLGAIVISVNVTDGLYLFEELLPRELSSFCFWVSGVHTVSSSCSQHGFITASPVKGLCCLHNKNLKALVFGKTVQGGYFLSFLLNYDFSNWSYGKKYLHKGKCGQWIQKQVFHWRRAFSGLGFGILDWRGLGRG